jgi:hypothetical protein
LLTYATLVVCALVALALWATRTMDSSARQRWLAAGAVVVVCQVGFAAFQIVQSRRTLDEMTADIHQMERDGAPPNFYAPRDYRFIPDHPIEAVDVPGRQVMLDIPDSPFVEVRSGGTRAGATADGLLVVDLDADPLTEVVVGPATPLPARIGQWLSLLGIAMAIALSSGWWWPSRRCSNADGRD